MTPNKKSISDIGGKAHNLQLLENAGFKVPNFKVVPTQSFYAFLKKYSLERHVENELANVGSKAVHAISCSLQKGILDKYKYALNEIKKHITGFSCDRVAVRSSSVQEDGTERSWAGQFDSFLNIPSDLQEISFSVVKCWASLYNSRAMNYGREKYTKLSDMGMAVIIQEMIQSDTSGVVFSESPFVDSENTILIEAVKGSGEKLVSGEVIPYSVSVAKNTLSLIKSSGGQYAEDILSNKDIIAISEQAKKIEKLFGSPVDIEWAIKDRQLYILQARPITTKTKSSLDKVYPLLPNIYNYEMTFKVTGLSFLFTDVLARGFKYLSPLFSCARNEFRQYFTNEKISYAADYGLSWLSEENGFDSYKAEFSSYYQNSFSLLKRTLEKSRLSLKDVELCFDIFSNLFTYYSKMDFQFTNLTYAHKNDDDILSINLEKLSKFKDFAREWINSTLLEDGCEFAILLAKLEGQFHINTSELEQYKCTEILSLFDGGIIDTDIINERKKAYLIFEENNFLNYIWGERALNYFENLIHSENIITESTLIGQVANTGKEHLIVGEVCIINVDYSNFDKMNREIEDMKDGAVLVAEFTAPELIKACKKAKAIVTDLGGMLSHAAIVSREFNIPCVVGTRSASKTLNKGDEVLIDLNQGVIQRVVSN